MKWIKKGLIFKSNYQRNWMASHSQIPYPVDMEAFIRIFFATREPYINGKCRSFGAYVDVDKSDFTNIINISDNPVIKPGELGEFDEFGVMPSSIIPVGKQYYMYYCGWTRMESVPHKEEIGLAISDDGSIFKKIGKGPILGDDIFESLSQSYPIVFHKNGQYHMFYHSGIRWIRDGNKKEIEYKIRHAISYDGVKWERKYNNIIMDILPYESQTSPTVFEKEGLYHMYFCYRYSTDFRKKERGYRIGYAISSDLVSWERHDEDVGIVLSSDGWDSQMMCYPCVKKINQKYYMFYCGNEFGKDGFGYAELC